jgi:hypothetical protein
MVSGDVVGVETECRGLYEVESGGMDEARAGTNCREIEEGESG